MKLSYALIISTVLALSGCESAPRPADEVASVVAKFSEQAKIDYQVNWVDLNNDGIDEALVLLQGMEWCGSGGCTFLVLAGQPEKDGVLSYNIVSQSTVTRAPIRVSEIENQGWKNLIVHSGSEDKLLVFDGKRYPPNPSLEPSATEQERKHALVLLP